MNVEQRIIITWVQYIHQKFKACIQSYYIPCKREGQFLHVKPDSRLTSVFTTKKEINAVGNKGSTEKRYL